MKAPARNELPAIAWAEVHIGLECNPDALDSLQKMEATRGESDVIGRHRV